MFPYFEFLGKTIGSYAVCAIIGLFVCGITAVFLGRRYKIAVEDIILVMVSIGIGLLIGGHLLYGITNLDKLTALFRNASSYSPKEFMLGLGQCFGGMVYYGGFLGAAAGVFLHTKFSKAVDRAGIFDLFAVTIPLFHAFARVGCFLGGCCYGIESRWGFAAHNNTLVPEVNGVVRLPVQLLEAACNLVIFAVLLFLFREGIGKGKLIWYYLLFYPVVRFVLEFFRGDAARGFLWGLSTSQWISILLFACAVIRLGSGRRKGRAVCAGALLGLLIAAGAGMGSRIAFAAEEAPQEVTAEQGQTGTQNESTVPEEGAAESADQVEAPGEQQDAGESAYEVKPMSIGDKFRLFLCCVLAIGICIAAAFWGDPRERLKDKYKRARKQQMLEEKKRKEREERAEKKAAEQARIEAEAARKADEAMKQE